MRTGQVADDAAFCRTRPIIIGGQARVLDGSGRIHEPEGQVRDVGC